MMKMNKFFITIFTFFVAVAANSQTIHWLTFIDTEDPNVGNLDKTGRNVLYNRFVNVVNAALHDAGYKSEIHDIYGAELSPERCKSEVERLNCSSDDIIVFYYIGHGTHAPAENNPYPQMLLGSSDQSRFIPLKWVHDALKLKGARLTATIGMCCNVIQNVSAKNAPMFSVNYGNVELTDKERTSIQNMFIGHKGDFLLCSASKGQSSLGGETPLGAMDLFTAVMVTVFEDMAYEGNLEWENLFGEVRHVVNRVTAGKQTPFWNNNLSVANKPVPQPISQPIAKNTNPSAPANNRLDLNNSTMVANYITSFFDCIIDKRNSFNERENAANKLKEIFTSDAIVKFLPQDGNTVIDKENINDFLGIISTSRLLEKIIPVSYVVDGNKISQISIKQCYNK